MDKQYSFEPSKQEIFWTGFIGSTFLQFYYLDFVKHLKIKTTDRILDYCSGSGIISQKAAKYLKWGELVFVDVSRRWLHQAAKRLKPFNRALGLHLCDFDGIIHGGRYNKIIVHDTIHDFPDEYHIRIITQLMKNLKQDGTLFIREPIGTKHGIKLYQLVNLFESIEGISYEYEIVKKRMIGEYVDVRCCFKNEIWNA
ncbi:MAG: class I SAM-dependent methyltransferase [Clostridia bacterium]|nr:class I SAM-dependent methyltransferase [Clostridia bacterium]